MEIFTFLRMGGKVERIELYPLSPADDAQGDGQRPTSAVLRKLGRVMSQFASFDAAKAQCFLEKDRQRLLAVIEAGFGDFREFNKIVRAAFAQRLDEHRISRQDSTYLSSRRSSGRYKVGVEQTCGTEASPIEGGAGRVQSRVQILP